MASTRNKNLQENYNVEIKDIKKQESYNMNIESCRASSTYFPGLGLLTGKYAPTELSRNNTDIENFLFGIRANDLTNSDDISKKQRCVPEIYQIPSLNIVSSTGGLTERELREELTSNVFTRIDEHLKKKQRYNF